MSDIAIRVEGLGKQYRIGGRQGYKTFRESLMAALQSPFRRLGALLGRRNGQPQNSEEIFWALKDVSFEVKQGEVVGIIGRNGAGKSTLLKVLSQITDPTSGRAEIRGRVGSLLEVGTGFHPELTGRENIFLNGAILGMRKAEIARRFDEIVAFSEVEKFIDTPVKRYSSGMYLRLAFAVAAHLEPEILLVDEVLAVGDAAFQKKCLGKMGDVAKEGRTVLFVSHNIPAILSLCKRSILLADGLKVSDDNSPEVVGIYLGLNKNLRKGEWSSAKNSNDNKPQRLIESIRLIDSTGAVANTLPPGEPFSIEIKFSSKNKLKYPRCGIGIQNENGLRIISLATFFDNNYQSPEWVSKGTILCTANNINLSPGNYFITVTVGDCFTDLDRVEHALPFEVNPDDIFGTGIIPNRSQGNFWTREQRWEIKDWKP